MKLTIKYFGLLAEVTRCDEDEFEFLGRTVSEFREEIYKKYSDLKNVEFQIAQDNNLVSNESAITSNEIALLPPFAGG